MDDLNKPRAGAMGSQASALARMGIGVRCYRVGTCTTNSRVTAAQWGKEFGPRYGYPVEVLGGVCGPVLERWQWMPRSGQWQRVANL